jgi:hypothetical protein
LRSGQRQTSQIFGKNLEVLQSVAGHCRALHQKSENGGLAAKPLKEKGLSVVSHCKSVTEIYRERQVYRL